MALLVECPKCKHRNSPKNNKCRKCLYTLKKASGKVYWIDYRINGVRKREKIGRSKQAAKNRLREVETALVEHRHIKINKNIKVTLSYLCNWYLDLPEIKELLSHSTLKGRLKNILRILGLGLTVEQLSIETINEYRSRRTQEPSTRRKDKLASVATINKEVSALKSLLNKAVIYKKIESNPIAKCSHLRVNNIRERILSEEKFEKLLSCSPEHIKPILIMAYYEPMRKDEIIKLEWSEIDLKNEPGFIRLSAQRTKGKKDGRVIPLHPKVKAILNKLPSRFQNKRVFLLKGKPFNNFKRSFDTAKNKAQIEDFVFHDFRHCAITNLRKAGNDYTTIMKASGHKTMSMFLRYNLVNEEDVAKIKWKSETHNNPDKIKSKLIAMGLDPAEVRNLLNQKEDKNSVEFV